MDPYQILSPKFDPDNSCVIVRTDAVDFSQMELMLASVSLSSYSTYSHPSYSIEAEKLCSGFDERWSSGNFGRRTSGVSATLSNSISAKSISEESYRLSSLTSTSRTTIQKNIRRKSESTTLNEYFESMIDFFSEPVYRACMITEEDVNEIRRVAVV
ncbi:hypothetical protein HK096_002206, partial [Nowakowskiella sp. JEL0078]